MANPNPPQPEPEPNPDPEEQAVLDPEPNPNPPPPQPNPQPEQALPVGWNRIGLTLDEAQHLLYLVRHCGTNSWREMQPMFGRQFSADDLRDRLVDMAEELMLGEVQVPPGDPGYIFLHAVFHFEMERPLNF